MENHNPLTACGAGVFASIRPQPKGRGEPSPFSSYQSARIRLQFGHSQKAVENLPWSDNTAMGHEPLQFGHSQKAVENTRMVECGNGACETLQFGHSQKAVENLRVGRSGARAPRSSFNSATAKRPWRTPGQCDAGAAGQGDASIRPQPKGRGEPTNQAALCFGLSSLQFGHSQKAVENPTVVNVPAANVAGFNSATAKRPWRTIRRGVSAATGTPASIRPQPKGRGELGDTITRIPGIKASIRPQPKGRGEPSPRVCG